MPRILKHFPQNPLCWAPIVRAFTGREPPHDTRAWAPSRLRWQAWRPHIRPRPAGGAGQQQGVLSPSLAGRCGSGARSCAHWGWEGTRGTLSAGPQASADDTRATQAHALLQIFLRWLGDPVFFGRRKAALWLYWLSHTSNIICPARG